MLQKTIAIKIVDSATIEHYNHIWSNLTLITQIEVQEKKR